MKCRDKKGRFVKGHTVPEEWRRKLSRPRPRIWSEEEIELLKRFYPQKTSEELSQIIEKKVIGQIISKAHGLKLQKTEETLRRIRRGRPSHRKGLTLEEEYDLERAKEIREKMRRNAFWKGKRQPLWLRQKKSLKLKGTRTGDKNPAKRPEVRGKIAQTLRNGASSFYKFNEHPEWRKKNLESCMKKPTVPEKILIQVIERHDLPFRYTGNGQVIIGTINPDFVHNNGKRKVIEVFGRIFHDPSKTFKHEVPWRQQYFGRIAYYAQYGYDCLILWDDELDDEKAVVNKVTSFLGEGITFRGCQSIKEHEHVEVQ
jgi:hypothetical protein